LALEQAGINIAYHASEIDPNQIRREKKMENNSNADTAAYRRVCHGR
jgi:hypothetical protein